MKNQLNNYIVLNGSLSWCNGLDGNAMGWMAMQWVGWQCKAMDAMDWMQGSQWNGLDVIRSNRLGISFVMKNF